MDFSTTTTTTTTNENNAVNNKNKRKRDHNADESNKIMKRDSTISYDGPYNGKLPVLLYLKRLNLFVPGTDVLGIKDVRQPADNNNKRIVKWYYCDVADDGELIYKNERIGYSPKGFVKKVFKKNVSSGMNEVYYDNKPLSYWLWFAQFIDTPEDKYYLPDEEKRRQLLREIRIKNSEKKYLEMITKKKLLEKYQQKEKEKKKRKEKKKEKNRKKKEKEEREKALRKRLHEEEERKLSEEAGVDVRLI